MPGSISSPASRIDEPSNSTSRITATNTTTSAWRAVSRRPFGAGGTGGSELEG